MDPGDVDPRVCRCFPRSLQRHPGHLQRSHVPALLSQPHRVGPLAATHIQHRAGLQCRHLRHERAIGFTTPHASISRIPRIPHLSGRGRIGCDVCGIRLVHTVVCGGFAHE